VDKALKASGSAYLQSSKVQKSGAGGRLPDTNKQYSGTIYSK